MALRAEARRVQSDCSQERRQANLYSMDGQTYDQTFPTVFEALSKTVHTDFVLDGELVALEPSGRPNFNELQNHRHTHLPVVFIVFDILNFKKRSVELRGFAAEPTVHVIDQLREMITSFSGIASPEDPSRHFPEVPA